ncbi:serine/threonine protein kinase [Methylocella silvestris BL2]|uniref:Serine/threonine protein kinase n=1 Tax=Methylocella silvestris (strain DSM 15510 / CIP 108128 / LMG 27833 / NCIMB 13906 / BL2) TaxID=395965 RepID=B8ETF3_METSB|nr:serine/threonine-protein kinase [Methylocella silvestris]ACK51795.1 serine/threonine protein kinase [Methylocella silvestris BL2]
MNHAATFGSTRPIIPAGTQLNGIYEIDEPIAAGGMGEIYKGHAIQTGDIVAIKLIRSDLAEAEAAFALFRREASALHNLYHEAIVRYYVFTVDPVLERPYLAMEYVDGQSLSAMLRGGPLAFEAVYRLMQRIAAGLNAAHERGIVHRDVSPDNIIIPGGDMSRAKIIDFGIARSTRLDDEGTVIGAGFAGKYNYVSPEQLGLYGGEITPKSDIYSLGLVLAEALRNGPIDMGGNHVDVIEKRRAVPELGPIDERLRPLIEHMLQPNPDDRPASMAEVAAWKVGTVMPQRARIRAAPALPLPKQGMKVTFGRVTAVVGGLALIAVAAAIPTLYETLRPPQTVDRPAPVLQSDSAPPARAPKPSPPADDNPAALGRPQAAAAPADVSPVRPGLAPLNLATVEPDRVAPAPASDAATEVARRTSLAALTKALGQYDGGDCFFAKPVVLADNAPAIEGFGLSSAPFRSLDETLRQTAGREADIGVRQIAPGQCPAISFLNELRNTPAAPIKLDIATASLRAGQQISGSVAGSDGREASVLIVGDDGVARPAAMLRAARDDPPSFTARPGAELGGGKLQLVIAIAAAKPLPALKLTPAGAPAAKLFPQILAEAERSGLTLAATVRSFRIDR